jgi:hypothetical protein
LKGKVDAEFYGLEMLKEKKVEEKPAEEAATQEVPPSETKNQENA